jgi:hypothetical protein
MSRTDLLQFQCISDTTTGASAGSEVFQVTGSAAYNNINDSLWPGGTGINTTMASSDYENGINLVTNGTFETWVGGSPDSWTTTGTGIAQLTSGAFRGTSALQITASVAGVELTQSLPTTVVGPGKRIIFGFWYKKISGTTSQDISLEMTDNTSGAAAVVDASATSTSWAMAHGSYQSSFDAPVTSLTATLRYADSVGPVVAVDGLFVYVPEQAGTNGQFFQIISGSTDWRIGDRMTVQVTNNYASSVLSYTERFFAPFANGIELPTIDAAAPPTVTNSVIP